MGWKEAICKDERYRGFSLLDKPDRFCRLFADKDIRVVRLHSTDIYDAPDSPHIVGFCGVFQWMGKELKPLDGDSYSENTLVLGYHWFFDQESGLCLDILVGDDW